ncbi:acetyl-CoA C-acyltransferase [Halobacillus sp. A5]|uniref:thiolase family protein n=1 Tax=Halobacillus sp. A5 TaxID=2880263 RepID=UPI0020A68334|nr:thiolase family protein [Halobacillus sp. A5]
MPNTVIVESVRTPIGKLGGTIRDVPVDYLAAKVIKETIQRSGIEENMVDEVILGQAKQSSDASNMARVALLRAGLPNETPGYTIHRQCGSGLQAINNADMQIKLGLSDVMIAGGAESMSTAPYYIRNARFGYRSGNGLLLDPNTESQPNSQPFEEFGNLTMGMTAENLASVYSIERQEQDEFALRSQELAARAIHTGLFQDEIVPYEVKERKKTIKFDQDEHPRTTTFEKLQSLKPVFKDGGTVTAGNSSGRNDGASSLLLMNESFAKERGFTPKAKILSHASAGVSPDIMGIGPVEATKKALKISDLTIEDIDLIELNEAFSAQALSVLKDLNLDLNKVNVNGGAIALGHPIGATGAILATKIVHEMERRGARYGLVTLCIAGGMGITTIFENLRI